MVPTLLPLCVALGRMTWRQGRLWGHEFGGDTELLRPAGSRSGKPLLPDLGLRAPCGHLRPGGPHPRLAGTPPRCTCGPAASAAAFPLGPGCWADCAMKPRGPG